MAKCAKCGNKGAYQETAAGLLCDDCYFDGLSAVIEAAPIRKVSRPSAPGGDEVSQRICARCKHPQGWHSHADEECLSTHPQPCTPDVAPFRCLGYDCEAPGFPHGTPKSRCGCPDFRELADV